MASRLRVIVAILVAAVGCSVTKADAIVNTTIGQIRGTSVPVSSINKQITTFLGIPYAEPPIGNRRFQRPDPKKPTVEIFNATSFSHMCPQDEQWVNTIQLYFPSMTAEEDCLSLNIYVPESASEDSRAAVMIWFHGGGHLVGTANVFDPSILTSVGNVIVVTVNYRLGVLGFLTSEDSSAMGNYGLWDQRLAMLWVKDNIANFGGNPELITIFGESSGSTSVSLQSLIPRNVDLFKRVISQSGTALVPGALVDHPKVWFKLLSQKLNCDNGDGTKTSSDLVTCLRSKTVSQVIQAQVDMRKEYQELFLMPAIGKIQWGPWADGDLIPLEPAQLFHGINSRRLNRTLPFLDVDQMIGVNSQEGALFYDQQLKFYKSSRHITDISEGLVDYIYQDFVKSVVKSVTGTNHSAYADLFKVAIDHEYERAETDRKGDIGRADRFIDILSDLTFYMGAVSFARVHSTFSHDYVGRTAQAKTFVYYFDHRGSWKSHESWRIGADHADDLDFVFGLPFTLGLGSTSGEKSLSSGVMTFWSNFAKTGDPNSPEDSSIPSEWPEFTFDTQQYMLLRDDYTNLHPIGRYLHKYRIGFWTSYFPLLRASVPVQPTCPLGA